MFEKVNPCHPDKVADRIAVSYTHLGRFITKYRTDYFTPDKRNGQIIYSYKPLPYAEDAIYRQISDLSLIHI